MQKKKNNNNNNNARVRNENVQCSFARPVHFWSSSNHTYAGIQCTRLIKMAEQMRLVLDLQHKTNYFKKTTRSGQDCQGKAPYSRYYY